MQSRITGNRCRGAQQGATERDLAVGGVDRGNRQTARIVTGRGDIDHRAGLLDHVALRARQADVTSEAVGGRPFDDRRLAAQIEPRAGPDRDVIGGVDHELTARQHNGGRDGNAVCREIDFRA